MPPKPDVELKAPSACPEEYDERNGYLLGFLGNGGDSRGPLPLLKVKEDLFPIDRAPKGQNSGATISQSRRLCGETSVNIKGSAPFPSQPSGLEDRPARSLRGSSRWPGILRPAEFDRGHFVRELDPLLDEESTARSANADTCHLRPQARSFGASKWGDAKDRIPSQEQSLDKKGSASTDPMFLRFDPLHALVQVPFEFFKIVVAVVDDARGRLTVMVFRMRPVKRHAANPKNPAAEAPFDPGSFPCRRAHGDRIRGTHEFRFLQREGLRRHFPRQPASASGRSASAMRLPLAGVRNGMLWES